MLYNLPLTPTKVPPEMDDNIKFILMDLVRWSDHRRKSNSTDS